MHDDDLPELPPTHAFCSGCQQTRPIADFKRFMTPAEMRYRGYSGNRKVLIETAKCKDCRPRRRVKPESFTTAELKKKAARGEISPVIANALAKTRAEKAWQHQRAVTVARWDKHRAEQWAVLVDAINQELIDVRQQRAYAKRRGDRPGVIAYVNGYCEILRRIRADLKLAGRKATKSPEHSRWQDYLHTTEKNTIAALWSDVEFLAKQSGMRPPHAFARPETSEVVVPVFRNPYRNIAMPPKAPKQPQTTTDPDTHTPGAIDWDSLN